MRREEVLHVSATEDVYVCGMFVPQTPLYVCDGRCILICREEVLHISATEDVYVCGMFVMDLIHDRGCLCVWYVHGLLYMSVMRM